MNGIIAKRSIEDGANVMPGVSAFKLVSIDEVYINVPVPENEIGSIKTGEKATAVVLALNDGKFNGVIDKKGVEANPVSRTYALKIKVGNPKSELMPWNGLQGVVAK